MAKKTGEPTGPRWPLGPLVEYLERFEPETDKERAEAAGVGYRKWLRWRSADSVPWWAADEVATFLGQHPAAIWEEYWAETDDGQTIIIETKHRHEKEASNGT